ncbi:unnamed protein product [Linum trigynum]|uniref:RING-type E3 ubiquitin transferase n=1 Tax=Linum trigynum TaxID=586398 RepID=A0AAV2E709_9ROSI
MPIFPESSTIGDQIRLRRSSRNHFDSHYLHRHQLDPAAAAETDPNPQLSRPAKSTTISSLFISPFSANSTEPPSVTIANNNSSVGVKKKGTAAFRGLGCAAGAARQVSVPAVIRSSAEWDGKKVKKKMKKKALVASPAPPPPQQQRRKMSEQQGVSEERSSSGEGICGGLNSQGNCMVIQDVWCGPGIGFSGDAVVDSVDCVVTRRNLPSARGRIDVEKFINSRERERERERPCLTSRRAAPADPEAFSFWDAEPAAFAAVRPEPELFGTTRYYRHFRRAPPDGLAEVLMLQNGFVMGGRMDRFSDWRLDIDDMSYEQLLELGDKIGHVSTGLKEDEIAHCIRKFKLSGLNGLSSHNIKVTLEKKCSVCQEEYEGDDEVGKLECGHGFHIQCIKQWLAYKNKCPVCKTEPLARRS